MIEKDGFVTMHVFPRPEAQLELFSPTTPLNYRQELDMLNWRAVADLPFSTADLARMQHLMRAIIEQAGGRASSAAIDLILQQKLSR
jgi:hypothetical protein